MASQVLGKVIPKSLEEYKTILPENVNEPRVWGKKGIAHKILGEFGEALAAFSRAKILDPTLKKMAEQHEKEIVNQLRATAASEIKMPKYIDEAFRPSACREAYNQRLEELQSEMPHIRSFDFAKQTEHVLKLIQFFQDYLLNTTTPYSFMKPELFDNTEEGRSARIRVCSETVLKNLPPDFEYNDDLLDKLDPHFLDLLEATQQDIFFEDSKKIWRMIFETIYFFPRAQRGDFVKHLPWGDNSWFLFEICGAIMCDDKTVEALYELGGSCLIPYQFNDSEKNKQQAHFFLSLINHNLVVKSACKTLHKDMEAFRSFFLQLQALNGAPPPQMEELPGLNILLRYSRQLFSTHRLFCLLPLAVGNQPMEDSSFQQMGLNTKSDKGMVDLFKTIEEEANPGDKEKISELVFQIFSCFEPESPPTTEPVTMAKRLQLSCSHSYLNLESLKGRLAIMRKLQLVGEIFTPRNWNGRDLKKIDYIHPGCVNEIRNRLTHIEAHPHYFQRTIEIESDRDTLQTIFNELKNLRTQLHYNVVDRQQHFENWPSPASGWNNQAFKVWGPFIEQYWQSVCDFYSNDAHEEDYIPHNPLLPDAKKEKFLNLIPAEHRDEVRNALEGTTTWLSSDRLSQLQQQIEKNKKREFTSLLREATINFNKFKKQAHADKITNAMSQHFPTIRHLESSLRPTSAQQSTSKDLFEALRNRFSCLEVLFKEQNMPNIDEDSLTRCLSKDIAFSLSCSYLLGQILELLNQSLIRVHLETQTPLLEKDLPMFVALRNHLEHTDPIFETLDFPYYEMQSDTPRLMANITLRLVNEYRNIVMAYFPENLPQDILDQIEASEKLPLKQQEALDPALYVS